MLRTTSIILVVLLAVGAAYLGIRTFFEAADASDVGKRVVLREGKQCVETYRFKDGLPLKVDCPK